LIDTGGFDIINTESAAAFFGGRRKRGLFIKLNTEGDFL